MASYGQWCPVAMAAEVLTERWTPLIVRELLCGSTRFNDLRRGVPLMSPSLLSKRLETLCRVGVVARAGGEYRLTPAGKELRPIIELMGLWGHRWARGDIVAKHHDAGLLMWDITAISSRKGCLGVGWSCISFLTGPATARATSGWCSTRAAPTCA
jgi:DNA-binding HxlR family transcriptional regulator